MLIRQGLISSVAMLLTLPHLFPNTIIYLVTHNRSTEKKKPLEKHCIHYAVIVLNKSP